MKNLVRRRVGNTIWALELPAYLKGGLLVRATWWGGPADEGVGRNEGLAFANGLARELEPHDWYCAIRLPVPEPAYREAEYAAWAGAILEVQCPDSGRAVRLRVLDRGPRDEAFDMSPGAYSYLEIEHDGPDRLVCVGLSEDQDSAPGPWVYPDAQRWPLE